FHQFKQVCLHPSFTRLLSQQKLFKSCFKHMEGHNLFFRLLLPALLLATASIPSDLTAQCLSGNCQNGTGKYRYSTGAVYTGQFVNGNREGKGKLIFPNNNVYDGQFSRNRINGEGSMSYSNGDRYV